MRKLLIYDRVPVQRVDCENLFRVYFLSQKSEKALCITYVQISAIVWATRCTPSQDDTDLHCGDADNMTCNDVHYVPYCHPLRNTNEGVCTCEKGT